MRLSIWLFATIPFASACLADSSLAGCEPWVEVRDALREQLKPADLDKLKSTDQALRQHQVLDDLIAKYPQEVEPFKRLITFVRNSEPEQFPALQDRFRQQVAQHPDDPIALYVAGLALKDTDTDESIRLLNASIARAPAFAWPALQLAEIYAGGKRAEKKKSAEYLKSFFSACPASTDREAQWLLSKTGDAGLQSRVARSLRERLEKETDRGTLLGYETLWGLEFRIRPPQQHAAERERVAGDLKLLESLDVKRDGEWMDLLRNGYKQSGASAGAVAAVEDRTLRDFPASGAAYGILRERFKKAHPEPTDQKDAAAWAGYKQVYREALKGWIRDCTEVSFLSRSAWFYEIYDDNPLNEKEGLTALDHYLKGIEYEPPSSSSCLNAAEFLIEHKWQPKRALDLLHKAQPLLEAELKRQGHGDNMSQEEAENFAKTELYYHQEFAGLLLRAARQAGRPAEVQSLRASIEGPPPSRAKRQSDYWLNRARLAVLDNRKVDALTYFQLALRTRVTPAVPWHGKLDDTLTDEARALWNEMGGTEVAWAAWSKPPAAKVEELKEGRWEKPTKQIPAFEITDLSGKTWKLVTLEGKSLLINLWATWCGPCNEELPHLEELYKRVKNRSDVQILSFNMDEDLGLVEPFVKEKGFTFPVLPAFSLVNGLFDNGWGIPQNWIIDPQGKWRWTQLGFGAEPDWVEQMIQRMESVRKSDSRGSGSLL